LNVFPRPPKDRQPTPYRIAGGQIHHVSHLGPAGALPQLGAYRSWREDQGEQLHALDGLLIPVSGCLDLGCQKVLQNTANRQLRRIAHLPDPEERVTKRLLGVYFNWPGESKERIFVIQLADFSA